MALIGGLLNESGQLKKKKIKKKLALLLLFIRPITREQWVYINKVQRKIKLLIVEIVNYIVFNMERQELLQKLHEGDEEPMQKLDVGGILACLSYGLFRIWKIESSK